MAHEEYREMIELSLHGELNQEEISRLERHLEACESCRLERENLKQLFSAFSSAFLGEPSEDFLWEARRKLFHAMRQGESGKPRSFEKGFSWKLLPGLNVRTIKVGLALAASLFLGLLVGYLTFAPAADQIDLNLQQLAAGDLAIANVRIPEAADQESGIQVSFDLVRRVRLSGPFSDERIQRVLAYALVSGQNAGVRLQAAELISSEALSRPDPEIQAALVAALKTDDNPAVRERAMTALAQYPFAGQLKDALLYVLSNDDNPKLRIEAIKQLERNLEERQDLDPSLLRDLRERMESEPNDYIRLRGQALLEKAALIQ